jgi:coenzyme F420 hydrogenase subunit beta
MGFANLRADVLDADLCASCGACVAACPQDLLRISIDEPIVSMRADSTDDDCGGCDLCTEICPGRHTGVQASEVRVYGRERTSRERWTGPYWSAFFAQAGDPAVLHAASAGGATTTLLVTALRTSMIDAALVVGRDEERPWIPVPRLVTELFAQQGNQCRPSRGSRSGAS